MSGSDSGERGLFAERASRPRARPRPDAPESQEAPDARDATRAGGEFPHGSPTLCHEPDAAEVMRDVRQQVRATVDEWLSERSHTISLAVAGVVEEALLQLQAAQAARIREVTASFEERVSAAERDRAEAVRGAVRRRRSRVRGIERELRDRIERLEHSLTEASLEAVERLREVERQQGEKRLEAERAFAAALREKDEEIERLRRGHGQGRGRGSAEPAGDERFDNLADQLRSRRS